MLVWLLMFLSICCFDWRPSRLVANVLIDIMFNFDIIFINVLGCRNDDSTCTHVLQLNSKGVLLFKNFYGFLPKNGRKFLYGFSSTWACDNNNPLALAITVFNVGKLRPDLAEDGTDCCSWERIKCNNVTGSRVTEISLNQTREWKLGEWYLNADLLLSFGELEPRFVLELPGWLGWSWRYLYLLQS